MSSGQRVCYMLSPTALLDRLASTFRATTWMAAPLMAEVASRLVRSGEAARLAELQRAEAIARQDVAMRMLSGVEVATHPASFHLGLAPPEPWRRREFTPQIRPRGVG